MRPLVFLAALPATAIASFSLFFLATEMATAARTAPPDRGVKTSYERYVAPLELCPYSDSTSASAATQKKALACLINYARKRKGLQRPLTLNGKLAAAAGFKLADNVRCNEFSHTACGKPFPSVFQRAGYANRKRGYSVGENLAWGSGELRAPAEIMRSWLDSKAHRKNLFEPRWREMGVGFRRDTSFLGHRGVTLWASAFGVLPS